MDFKGFFASSDETTSNFRLILGLACPSCGFFNIDNGISTRAGGGLDVGGLEEESLDDFERVLVFPRPLPAALLARALRRVLVLPRTILFFSVLLPCVSLFLILIFNVPAVQGSDTTKVIWGCVKN